jgi:anti-sigma B factor antagonist
VAEQRTQPGQLHVDVSHTDRQVVVTLRGDVDVYSSAQLRDELTALIDAEGGSIVVDLAGLDFLDSTGLGVLVGAQKRVVQGGGQLVLRAPRPGARKVFEITGLDKIFVVED